MRSWFPCLDTCYEALISLFQHLLSLSRHLLWHVDFPVSTPGIPVLTPFMRETRRRVAFQHLSWARCLKTKRQTWIADTLQVVWYFTKQPTHSERGIDRRKSCLNTSGISTTLEFMIHSFDWMLLMIILHTSIMLNSATHAKHLC